MYVWFYVLNHSKYRFPFHAVYIGIVNGIRKPTFHAARYNRLKYLGSDVRSRPLQSAPRVCFGARTVVILHRERPALGSRSGGFSKFSQKIFRRGFLPSSDGSELYLCMPKSFSAYKGARSARPGGVPKSRHLTTYDMTSVKKRIGRPTTTAPRVHRYNFKLTTEENIRFKQMLCEAGLEHNRSRFIVKRLFAEEFVVVRRDPSKVQFIARLNDFYFQFQKLGNNYNQIVKVINAHFSNVAIPHQIAALEQRTRGLKALSIEILNLAKQAKEWLRI